MELKLIFSMVWRWGWLLVLGLILGAAAAFVASKYQTPVYQATAELMVFQNPESGVSDLTDLSDQELINTYIRLLTSRPVLEETSQLLGFPVSSGQVNGRQVSGTRLIQVTARDSKPERAELIANQIVDVLINQNEALQTSRFSASEESYLAQIAQIEEQIAQLEEQISSLQEDEALRSEESLALLQQQLEDQRRELEAQILALQGQIAELELEIESLTVPSAEVLEDQRQQLDDEISSLQSRISELELEIDALMPRAIPGAPAPPLTESQRQELLQKQTRIAELQVLIDQENSAAASESREPDTGKIISMQSEIVALELEIDELMPRASSGAPAPPLTESQREEMSQKRSELAQLQFKLDRALQNYDALGQGEVEIQPLTDSQRQELSEKRAELALLQFELDLATQNYSALSQPGLDLQPDSTDPVSVDQQQAALTLYQQIYTTLLNNYESVRLARLQNTPSVVLVESAITPMRPVEPNIFNNVVLGAVVGLMVMGGIAFVIEYLDDTIRAPGDVAQKLNVPVVGYVPEVRDLGKPRKQPFVATHPHSHFAEAFRILKTNLELIGNEKKLKTILIASPGSAEGKTTIASNLAVVWAQGKKRTILVDCDLRKPMIHRSLGLPNEVGMSDMLNGKFELSETLWSWKGGNRLGVITSGSATSNPSELITSSKMAEPMAKLERLADVIILDGPPFVVADAMVLAAEVDGVVMVVQPGRTSTEASTAMLEQLDRSGANVIGVVFNRISRKRRYYLGSHRNNYMSEYKDRIPSENGRPSKKNKSSRRVL